LSRAGGVAGQATPPLLSKGAATIPARAPHRTGHQHVSPVEAPASEAGFNTDSNGAPATRP